MTSDRVEAVFRHTHLLGTVVDVRIHGGDEAACASVDRVIVDEIMRLQSVFDAYDPHSELSRWKRDEAPRQTAEFVEVMTAALDWQRKSDGAFNPMSGVLTDRWRLAEEQGTPPSVHDLSRLAGSIIEPRFVLDGDRVRRFGDCAALNLNAIAKGYIVDRACSLAFAADDVSMVLVSAGGDLRHLGESAARVGIADPLRPYDNEPPVTVIELRDAGLATSGGARRGFRVGAQRFSHVIDPRTGMPVEHQASISVAAPSAVEADALTTTLGMVAPADAVEAAERLPARACLVIGSDGSRWPSTTWIRSFGDPRS